MEGEISHKRGCTFPPSFMATPLLLSADGLCDLPKVTHLKYPFEGPYPRKCTYGQATAIFSFLGAYLPLQPADTKNFTYVLKALFCARPASFKFCGSPLAVHHTDWNCPSRNKTLGFLLERRRRIFTNRHKFTSRATSKLQHNLLNSQKNCMANNIIRKSPCRSFGSRAVWFSTFRSCLWYSHANLWMYQKKGFPGNRIFVNRMLNRSSHAMTGFSGSFL